LFRKLLIEKARGGDGGLGSRKKLSYPGPIISIIYYGGVGGRRRRRRRFVRRGARCRLDGGE